MNQLLRWVVVILTCRTKWRKLVFIGFFIVTGLVLQSPSLPYPMTKRGVFDESDLISVNRTSNRITLTTQSNSLEPDLDSSTSDLINYTSGNQNRLLSGGKDDKISSGKSEKKIRALSPSPPSPLPSKRSLVRYIASLTPEEGLRYAKQEIVNAPAVIDDPDLYGPLFRNVSAFKRSYELMELILKVYIYQDGERPIFHQPNLRGIYSSEGWFMKLLEANRQYVQKEHPEKAHLFYLPYSAHQMQMSLYKPDTQNIKRISIFLRDYVNMLAAKYPFWNRTQGRDHFLVACHDWGPYTLVEHDELAKNPIKALCNADVSEGIFRESKDVSLPETTIRNPRRPLKDHGGKRVSQRTILAFFAGRMHGRVRPILRKYWDGKDEDMRIYGTLPKRIATQMSYIQHMKSSRFCICPMGYEVNSPRIVEAIYYECVPVIIADNFVPPLNEVLDWRAFSIIVPEKDIPRLKEILLGVSMRRYLVMQNNVKMLQKHFRWNTVPVRYNMFHMILHSIWLSRVYQMNMQIQS